LRQRRGREFSYQDIQPFVVGVNRDPGDECVAQHQAKAAVADAKARYAATVTGYRQLCHRAGIACEYGRTRTGNVSARVTFLVEKSAKGVKVAVQGRPETEEVIPMAVLKQSVNKAGYGYTDKHLGPRDKVGNKGGRGYNRKLCMKI
jgi:hypothetical protein